MRIIQAKDRYGSILRRDEFRRHKEAMALLPGVPGELLNLLSLSALSKLSGSWSAEAAADGLNAFSTLCQKQDSFFPVWTEDEIEKDPAKAQVKLMAFPLSKPGKTVLICPGGGYASVASLVEGFPIAKRLNELGCSAFVLRYRCGKEALAPNPVEDIAQAVRYLRGHATDFGINMENYLVLGCSAGGHAVSSFGTERNGYACYDLPKPGGILLGYPVITMGDKTHTISRKNFLGCKKPDAELIRQWSVEEQITAGYPQTFVWQCDHDSTVPVENSALLVSALRACGIRVAYETFPSKAHGWGVADNTPAEGWLERAIRFCEEGLA